MPVCVPRRDRLRYIRPRVPPVQPPVSELEEQDRGDVIVLADASVEGEDLASILRARGFIVFDVPLALLESRVETEDPRIVVADVDQPGAIEKLQAIRRISRAHVFCLGDPLRAAELSDVSLIDNVFERPVDIQRLLDRATTVAVPSVAGFSARGTTPPPMYPTRGSIGPPAESIPPISDFPRAQDPLEAGSFLDEGVDPTASLGVLAGGQVRLSPQLAQQILEAEERIRADVERSSSQPAPGEDADCAVPAELLAPLDEPLDATDDVEGTGGMAAALAQVGSSTGSSVSVAFGGLTPAPIPGTGLTPLPEPTGSRGRATAASDGLDPSAPSPSGTGTRTNDGASTAMSGTGVRGEWPREGTDAIAPPSMAQSAGSGQRGASPAMGIRLGELLGIPEPKRSDTSAKGPPSHTLSAASVSELGAMSGSNLSPLSPPVRFQEPRDIAEGRALFDPRTVPPRAPASAASSPDRLASRDGSPLMVPPSTGGATPARPPTDRDDRGASDDRGVSPAAQSVRPARIAMAIGSGSGGIVFGDGEGFRPLARAIANRTSGCLSFVTSEGTRRVVLADGDLVTAASEISDESLLSFLASRGDLDRDAASRLAGKLPPSGRHAGAALIAQGHLAQNDLWPVLRAHAQWLIGNTLVAGPGSTDLTEEVPGRLKAEPNVFGGATGAEVFVETARRVLDPIRSLAALDEGARLDDGPRANLLAECALSSDDDALIRGAAGKTVGELCGSSQPDLASVVRALVELEVLSLLAPARRAVDDKRRAPDPIDEDAVRQKVKAKMILVQEGDYFSLLGVGRTATSYEIKRAFLELRRTFEPTRLLTARTADLHTDVSLILEVVEEAFEILKDERRRDRYRRAIEAGPPE